MLEDYNKVDVDEAVERLHMDKAFIEKLMKKFLESDEFEKAKKAFEQKDIEQAKISIHTIKGTAANVGATGLSKLALEIETKIKSDSYLDLELLNAMEKVWEELKNKFSA